MARVALWTVFKVTCCCYRNCYDASCYCERVIAIKRDMTNCYAATATANEFCYNYYSERAADANVARGALLTRVIVRMLELHLQKV